jgi:hypothetical protein
MSEGHHRRTSSSVHRDVDSYSTPPRHRANSFVGSMSPRMGLDGPGSPATDSFAVKRQQARRLVHYHKEDLRQRTVTFNQLHHRLPLAAAERCATLYLEWLESEDYFNQREAIVAAKGTPRTLAAAISTEQGRAGANYRFLTAILRAHIACPRVLTPLEMHVGLTAREKKKQELFWRIFDAMKLEREDFFVEGFANWQHCVNEAAREMPIRALESLLEFLHGPWGSIWVDGKAEVRPELRRLREAVGAKDSLVRVSVAVRSAIAEGRQRRTLLDDAAAQAVREAVSGGAPRPTEEDDASVRPGDSSDSGYSDVGMPFAIDADE